MAMLMRDVVRATEYAAGVTDAVKEYGKGGNVVRALDGVTVGFPRGRMTAIMGPSGSGKSTLMHCVAGLDALTSGHAVIGEPLAQVRCGLQLAPGPRRGIAQPGQLRVEPGRERLQRPGPPHLRLTVHNHLPSVRVVLRMTSRKARPTGPEQLKLSRHAWRDQALCAA